VVTEVETSSPMGGLEENEEGRLKKRRARESSGQKQVIRNVGTARGVGRVQRCSRRGRTQLKTNRELGVQTAWKKRSSSFLAPSCFFLLGPPPWQSLPVPASPPNQGPGILRYAGTRTGAAWGDGAPLKPPTPPMPTKSRFFPPSLRNARHDHTLEWPTPFHHVACAFPPRKSHH
jgi:hypothetical protein